MKTALEVSNSVSIQYSEFDFSYTTSSGAGGQNVNKVSTKAVMRWWPAKSAALTDEVKFRFMAKFRSRLTSEGELVLTSQRTRSQPQNANDCMAKLREMVAEALLRPKVRRATRPTKGSKVRRLKAKSARSETKQGRRKPASHD
jgi:ribosome-associated protein